MSGAKNIGIWIDGFPEDPGQAASPEAQEARARQYARSKGWTVRQVYLPEVKGGGKLAENVTVKRMLGDVKSGRISGLIMNSLGSLARNTKELVELAEFFKEHSADMIALEESVDTSTSAGKIFYNMLPAMAQWERKEISKRVKASVPERAKLGKSTGGQASFGYMWKDKKLVPNPKEAPVRRLVYELFLEHGRKKTVARILNERGYRTRNGSKFSDTTIARLLRDPTAKGVRRANYTRSLKEEKQWELKSQEDWIYSDVEAIVSEELWEDCNRILDEIEKTAKKPARTGVKLFTGIVYCQCGGKMYMPSNSPKYICEKCRRKISKNDLEEVFRAQLKEIVKSSQSTTQLRSDAEAKIKAKEQQLQTLIEERVEARKEMEKLFQLLNQGEIPQKGFNRRYNPLEERLGNIEQHMPELQGDIDYLKISNQSKKRLDSDSKELQTKWTSLSEEVRRKIIETIIEKITIGENEITLTMKNPPAPPQNR